MRDGSVIPYLDTYAHLGNILCTSDKHVMIDSAVKDLKYTLNICLLIFLIVMVALFPPCLIFIA